MINRPYPISLAEIESWRTAWGANALEAEKRFVQFVVLESFAAEAGVEEP